MKKDDHRQGFISLHRSILDWEWYEDVNTCRLFIHLLLTAEFKPTRTRGKAIKRGQRLATVRGLCKETGLSDSNTRTAINRLKSTHEITCEPSPQGTVITVKNYSKYQCVTQQPTHNPHTKPKNPHTTLTPSSNKIINNKRECVLTHSNVPFCGEFKNVLISPEEMDKLKEIAPGQYQDYIEQLSGYLASTGKKYKSHYATIRNWIRRDKASGKTTKEDDGDVL